MKVHFTNSSQRDVRHELGDLEKVTSGFGRLKGLLGQRELPSGSGIWLEPCHSVHCFGMKFAIDLIFVNAQRCVIGLRETVKPGEWTPPILRSHAVIEVPEGTIQKTGIDLGAQLYVDP